jgi:DNA-binding transcriptional MerR regulator
MAIGAEMAKSPQAFRTISEVAAILETPQHVLRFWETKFAQIKPVKRAGGRRYYRPSDIALLWGIKALLYDQAVTIKGVQKQLAERGPDEVSRLAPAPWNSLGDGQAWPLDGEPEGGDDDINLGSIVGPAEVEPLDGSGMEEFLVEELPPEGIIVQFPRPEMNAEGEAPEEAEPAAQPEEPAPEGGPSDYTLARLQAALRAADPERLRAAAPQIAPLLARLAALRERMGPRP